MAITGRLHPVSMNEDACCGPVAIAAVTGEPLERVVEMAGNGPVTMLETYDVLRRMGYQPRRDCRLWEDPDRDWRREPRITLGRWIREGYPREGEAYILPLWNHLVAVAGGEMLDNGIITPGEPAPLERFAGSRKALAINVWLALDRG